MRWRAAILVAGFIQFVLAGAATAQTVLQVPYDQAVIAWEPPIDPPPVVPPLVQPPPASPLTAVTVKGNDLTFDYKLAACPKGIQMKSGKIINGSRTVTMTCRK